MGAGELEREHSCQPCSQHVRYAVGDAAALGLDPLPPQRERELQQEDLLEGQRAVRFRTPFPQRIQAGTVLRKVGRAQRVQPGRETTASSHLLRYDLRDRARGDAGQRPIDDPPDRPGAQLADLAIDGDDPAGVDAFGVLLVEELVVGILEDGVPVAVPRGAPEQDHPALGHQHTLQVRLVVPDGLDAAARVGKGRFEDGEPTAARSDQPARDDSRREGALRAARLELGDGREGPPVLEPLRAARTDALDVAQLGLGSDHLAVAWRLHRPVGRNPRNRRLSAAPGTVAVIIGQ